MAWIYYLYIYIYIYISSLSIPCGSSKQIIIFLDRERSQEHHPRFLPLINLIESVVLVFVCNYVWRFFLVICDSLLLTGWPIYTIHFFCIYIIYVDFYFLNKFERNIVLMHGSHTQSQVVDYPFLGACVFITAYMFNNKFLLGTCGWCTTYFVSRHRLNNVQIFYWY